jgi:hypothetical protein
MKYLKIGAIGLLALAAIIYPKKAHAGHFVFDPKEIYAQWQEHGNGFDPKKAQTQWQFWQFGS